VQAQLKLLFCLSIVIVVRPPPDRIAFGARSDSVRRPIRFRTPPDRIPYAALIGGAAVSAAPTKQSTNQAINQPSNQPTKQSTNQATNQASNQPINQSTNQSTNQPASHLILPIKSSHISNKNINFANP